MSTYNQNIKINEIKEKIKRQFNFIDEQILDKLCINYFNNMEENTFSDNKDILDNLKEIIYKFLIIEFNNGKFFDYAFNLIKIYNSEDVLDKLNDLILIIQYNPSFEEIKKILSIDKVTKYIKNIVNKYYKKIINLDYSFVSNNEFLISLIDIYCDLNDIVSLENEVSKSNFNVDIPLSNSFLLFLEDLSQYKLLTYEEEQKLFRELKNGHTEVKEKIINSNLRFVVFVARKYAKNYQGFDLVDLIQEGCIGLITAVERYDLSKGAKFSTYAYWWIRQAITRAIYNQANTIKISEYMMGQINKLKRYKVKIRTEENRDPTDEEIMRELNLSSVKLKELYDLYERNVFSINQKIGDKEDNEFISLVPDDKNLSVEDEVMRKMDREYAWHLIDVAKMSERDKEIIKYRYGVYGRVYTLEEIGKIYHLTRERVRQIENKCLEKLREVFKEEKFKANLKKYGIDSSKDKVKISPPNFNSNITSIDSSDGSMLVKDNINEKGSDEMKKINNQEGKKEFIDDNDTITSMVTDVIEDKENSNLVTNKIIKKSMDNIYEYYSEYTTLEINNAIKLLSEDDIKKLYLKYGDDLEHPILNRDLTKKEKKSILNVIYKIGYILKRLKAGKIYIPKVKKNMSKEIVENNKNSKQELEIKDSNIIEPASDNKTFNIDIYQMFNNEEFISLTKTKNIKEIVILSLYLGYVNNTYYSSDLIADFLNLDIEVVNKVIITCLREYKEILLNNVDKKVENLIENSFFSGKTKQLVKDINK